MEELSIEGKATRYDKAIESLRAAFYDDNNRMCEEYRDACKRIIEPIFPELKEREDERIKKMIINTLNRDKILTEDEAYDCITWFEKQGQSFTKKDVDDAYLKGICDAKHELEKQGEQVNMPKWKYKSDNTPLSKDSIILNKYGCVAKSPSGALVSDVWVIDYAELAKLPKEVEKQGEQKPADKVEPKFKVGDWVVNNNGEPQLSQVISYSWPNSMIKRATNNLEIFINKATLDKQYHLWTIQDAKDGDVLYSKKHNIIWIYKDNEHYHACVNMNYVTENVATDSLIGIPNDVCPANRVQRSILFQKMEEAGYEWDAEKKELKKIEQKPTEWSLPYGKNETAEKLIALAECLEMDGGCLFNGLSGNDYGKFLRVLAIELTEVKPAKWSEEDENIRQWIISDIDKLLALKKKSFIIADKEINWLKSLKDRVGCEVNCTTTWKPSDEQMKQLGWIAKQNKDNMIGKELMTLYQDLLKQREE